MCSKKKKETSATKTKPEISQRDNYSVFYRADRANAVLSISKYEMFKSGSTLDLRTVRYFHPDL